MKTQEFRLWARRKLGQDGSCGVKVELTDNQLSQALDDAKEWFNAFVGFYKESTFGLIGEQSEYDLSSVTPGIESVVKVWFPQGALDIELGVLYPGFLDVEGIPVGSSGSWRVGYPQTTIVQSLQTMESDAKILSSNLDWEFYSDNTTTPKTKMVRVMPAPRYAGTAYYLYRVDPDDIELDQYDKRNQWMIRKWALAEAKYTLGRIRGKYKGLPSAGGERQLDGDDLIQESKDEKMMLKEEILDFQGPVMPLVY